MENSPNKAKQEDKSMEYDFGIDENAFPQVKQNHDVDINESAPLQAVFTDSQKLLAFQAIEQQNQSRDERIYRTFRRLHWLGWFLLFLFFTNLIEPIVGFKPFDPQSHWLLQSTLLANAWQLLLALALVMAVFAVPTQQPKPGSLTIFLHILIWLNLLIYVLLLPWTVSTAYRMHNLELVRFDLANAARSQSLMFWQAQAKTIEKPEDLQKILPQVIQGEQQIPVVTEVNFQDIFGQFQAALQKDQATLQSERQDFQQQSQQRYLRKASSFLFLGIVTVFLLGFFGRSLTYDLHEH